MYPMAWAKMDFLKALLQRLAVKAYTHFTRLQLKYRLFVMTVAPPIKNLKGFFCAYGLQAV